ncbi:MAG: PAS domain S-box protein [Chloroflexi bacterium]|nr:PAS domain S-box protein [Chloroflexota bacterium]
MNDEEKTKKQLLKELRQLRQQVADLQAAEIERRQAEKTLRESEQKYRTLIEQSDDAIFLIYGNHFEIVNRKLEELFGVTQEAANSPDFVFTNIVAPKSRKLVLERAKRESEGQKLSPRYEFTALNKDGREIEVELSVSYPAYRGGLATQGVLRDITERKKAEAESAAIQAQMFQSAKLASVGELAAGVAHEINNPIFAIREYADLILENTLPNDPSYRMLQTIIHQANRVANIVRNLLSFARPDESQFCPVHLDSVWQLVHNLIGQSLLKHGIQPEVDIPPDLPVVKANSQQLQQVLLNLVVNAKDALNEKYPDHHPNKRITLRASAAEDLSPTILLTGAKSASRQVVCLTVRDEGTGISAEHQEQIFTPFFTTKRPNRGTGLGLSISHKIIESHQGRIEVHSEPGVFTEFTVILPVDTDWTSEGDLP